MPIRLITPPRCFRVRHRLVVYLIAFIITVSALIYWFRPSNSDHIVITNAADFLIPLPGWGELPWCNVPTSQSIESAPISSNSPSSSNQEDSQPSHLDVDFLTDQATNHGVCSGRWHPTACQPLQRIALIVPYRNRSSHLDQWVKHMHVTLRRQQLDYRLLIIEQADSGPFNRGLLLNLGALLAVDLTSNSSKPVSCLIFHDVDMLPQNSANLYLCDQHMRHLASAVDEYGSKPPFANYLGGVTAISTRIFFKLNGFPNDYWGWGNEDDELAARGLSSGYQISRPPLNVGVYSTLGHSKASRGLGHYSRFRAFRAHLNNGLSSLQSSSWRSLLIDQPSPNNLSSPVISERPSLITAANLPFNPSECVRKQFVKNLLASLQSSSESVEVQFNNTRPTIRHQSTLDLQLITDTLWQSVMYEKYSFNLTSLYHRDLNDPPQPTSNDRESLYAFLHFYGWI